MYRVIKPSGNNANITVENIETSSSVVIGRLSLEIVNILETAGYKIDNYTEEMSIEIDTETKDKLVALTMKMKRPIRDQRKKTTKEETKKLDADVDAFDLIFGKV
jgi:hypothetical protein